MNSLWGMGQMMYAKMIIVVDADINPHDTKAVAKQVFESLDMTKDLVFSQGPLDALDHASSTDHYGYRLESMRLVNLTLKELNRNGTLKSKTI